MGDVKEKDSIEWTSEANDTRLSERRSGIDRRQVQGRSITVPDMRTGMERRRAGDDRRTTVRLTITGRAMDI